MPTALVLDDELLVARLIARILKRWGWTAVVATATPEAHAALRRQGGADVLIVDVQIGPEDGRVFCASLPPAQQARCLFMTGDPTAADALRDRGRRVLRKPFTIDGLRAQLDALTASSGLVLDNTDEADLPGG